MISPRSINLFQKYSLWPLHCLVSNLPVEVTTHNKLTDSPESEKVFSGFPLTTVLNFTISRLFHMQLTIITNTKHVYYRIFVYFSLMNFYAHTNYSFMHLHDLHW